MKKLIIIVLLALPFFMKAQAPGYQGKHFILSYNLGLGCNAIDCYSKAFQKEDPSDEYNPPVVNVPFLVFLSHSFQAEYVFSRKFGLEAEFSFLNNSGYEKDSNNGSFGPVSVETSGFGLNFVFYTGDNSTPAPVGNYVKIRTFTKTYKATGFVYIPSHDYNEPSIIVPTTPHTGSGYGVGLEFGHHQVAWNKVLFNASVCCDYSLLTPTLNTIAGREVNLEVSRHLTGAYLAYFKLGVGGLLF